MADLMTQVTIAQFAHFWSLRTRLVSDVKSVQVKISGKRVVHALCAGLGIELLSKLKSINSKRFCIISDSALPWDSRQNKDTLGRGYAFYHMIRVAFVCCLSFPFVVLILLLRKRASAVKLWYWAE